MSSEETSGETPEERFERLYGEKVEDGIHILDPLNNEEDLCEMGELFASEIGDGKTFGDIIVEAAELHKETGLSVFAAPIELAAQFMDVSDLTGPYVVECVVPIIFKMPPIMGPPEPPPETLDL